MKWLNLSNIRIDSGRAKNNIGDAGARILSECIYNIDGLVLEACNITEEGVSALAEKIKKRDTPVY